jgi:hypothetical protein
MLPVLSVVEDEFIKMSLSATLMKNAEIVQPWGTIGVDRWIQAGKWWLLKVGSRLVILQIEARHLLFRRLKQSFIQRRHPRLLSRHLVIQILSKHRGY